MSPEERARVKRRLREDPEYRRAVSDLVARELEAHGQPRFFVEQPSRRRKRDHFPCGCPIDDDHAEKQTDNRWPGGGGLRCKIHRRAAQNAANAAKRKAKQKTSRANRRGRESGA